MKRRILITIFVFTSFMMISQVYLPLEDFSGNDFPPEGWTIENGGDDNTFEQGPMPMTNEPPCAWIANPSNTAVDDRLISPEILLPFDTDIKLYAQLRGSVGYALAQYWDPDNEVRYFIEISNDGGNSWDVVLDLDDQTSVLNAGASWPWPDWNWFNVAIDISDYGGETVLVAFHHEKEFAPSGGGSFGITNIGVLEDIENDVQLLSMIMPDYSVVNNEVVIEGNLKNIGSNSITSFEGEYLIDGELAETFYVSGVNILQFESYSFTAGDPALFPSVDTYSVELTITKVNGEDDNSPENNTITKNISIASGTVDRKPLFEMFTSSTCGTCGGANENLDGILAGNPDSLYSLVKYQVNWPGSGDPYYIEDCGIRVDYYDVIGAPTFFSNGFQGSAFYFNQSKFDEALDEEAYVAMDLSYTFDGLNVSALLTVEPKINIEDASVYFAVVEKTTYNNIGTNGETEFHNVLMAMMPDGNGISTGLADGVTATFNGSTNLAETFIEEFDDLMIISWVQDNQTRSVLQSESYDLNITIGIDNFKNPVTVFPNPGNGIFTLKRVNNTLLEINDLYGKPVYRKLLDDEVAVIDISNCEKGIYIIKIFRKEQPVMVDKLIIR